jgi:hypothetical protein
MSAYFAQSSDLRTEALRSSEIPANFYKTARHYTLQVKDLSIKLRVGDEK